MKCPYCNSDLIKVIDSRPSEEQNAIRRRRQCENCNKRFTTYETIENASIIVIKKDHSREPYQREKLISGLIRSCHKRPISMAQIDQIVDNIENALYNTMKKEIETTYIGELVMEQLKELDQVAYVRFASIYREFKDINTFMNELNKLMVKTEKDTE